jgi:quinoprotein glucose dehydrogenase
MMIDRRTFTASLLAPHLFAAGSSGNWEHYGGDEGASRYSPLSRLTRSNVARLKPAWTHACGDAMQRPATTIECTPLVVDGVMYLTSARLQVRALNAATGEPKWNYNPLAGSRRASGVNRGLTHFADGKDRRVYAAIQDKLYCLRAASGELVKSFGDNGVVDLAAQFDRDMTGLQFRVTSPAVIFEDTLIVGGGGGEGPQPQAPGHIRGYDVYTGKRKWIFHTIPHPGEFGYDSWPQDAWQRNGSANNWAGLSIDRKRGWLFVSTGSALVRLLGWRPRGQQSLRQLRPRHRSTHRQADVALPGCSSRLVGLRFACPARARNSASQRSNAGCAGAGDQACAAFSAGSSDR